MLNMQTTSVAAQEDESRVATPVAASHHPTLPSDQRLAHASEDNSDDIAAFSASLASMLDSTLNLNDGGAAKPNDSHPNSVGPSYANPNANGQHKVLPLPTPSASRAQSAYILPDVRGEEAVVDLSDLAPEIASADISIARAYCRSRVLMRKLTVLSLLPS